MDKITGISKLILPYRTVPQENRNLKQPIFMIYDLHRLNSKVLVHIVHFFSKLP